MRRNNQSGFAHILGLFIVVLLLLIGGVGYYVYRTQENKKATTSTTPSSKSAKESSQLNDRLKELTKGIKGTFVGTINSNKCDNPLANRRDDCADMQAALYILEAPHEDNFVQLVTNLADNNWQYQGQPVHADQARSGYKEAVSQPESANENDAPRAAAPFLTLGFTLFSNGDRRATAYALSFKSSTKDIESEADYAFRHEVPGLEGTDYAKQIAKSLKSSTDNMLLVVFAN